MNIPIVFSTDNNYAIPMTTAIASLLANCNADTIYQVYVLSNGKLEKELTRKILTMFHSSPRHSIGFLSVDESLFDGASRDERVAHVTVETYYRLMISEIFPDISKCIYLDCDVIVLQDLSGLFAMDLGQNYIAGVKAAGYFFPPEKVQNTLNSLNIPSIDQYVNAGVLVMNLEQIRKQGLTERFMAASKMGMESNDQGVINSVCYGKIMHIPLQYNAMVKYIRKDSYGRWQGEKVYSADELAQAEKNPVIIHYADKIKPWHNPDTIWADIWLKYKEMTPFADVEIQPHMPKDKKHYTIHNAMNKIEAIDGLKGKRIALWGAGRLGAFYAECLQKLNMAFEITDKNESKIGMEVIPGVEVKAWEQLKNHVDIVLVSALHIAGEVKKDSNVTVPVYDLIESVNAGKLL